jgi:hypothetical protein
MGRDLRFEILLMWTSDPLYLRCSIPECEAKLVVVDVGADADSVERL